VLADLDHLRGFHYFCFGNCSLVARLRSRLIAVNMLYCSTSLPELLYDNKGGMSDASSPLLRVVLTGKVYLLLPCGTRLHRPKKLKFKDER